MPTQAILDASAIVALVMRERGFDTVRRVIGAGIAATTPTGLAEALTACRRKGYSGSRDELSGDLHELGLAVEPIVAADAEEMACLFECSDEIAARAGADAGKVGKLSLGDVACLAVARRLKAVAVVSDGTWELLGIRDLKVLPFR